MSGTRVISATSRRELSFFFLQGKAPKEICSILTETLACFLPGRAKDLALSAAQTLEDPAQVTEVNHVKVMCQLIVNRFEIWKDVTRIPCKTNFYDSRKETQALNIRTVPSDATSFI